MGEPFTINVRGAPRGVDFPKLCPNCGGTAVDKLLIERAFLHQGENNDSWQVLRAAPLFCPNCIAQHWREAKPLSALRRLGLALRTELTIAMIGPLLFGGFLCLRGLEDYAKHGDLVRAAVLVGIGGVMVLIGVGCLVGAYSNTEHKAITPPTSITSSVDFTSDQSGTFEPEWHRFTFRSAQYGEAFAGLNQQRIWDRHGEEARRAVSRSFNFKIVAYIVFAAVVLYSLYDEFIRPYF